jgi:hypothetical protein
MCCLWRMGNTVHPLFEVSSASATLSSFLVVLQSMGSHAVAAHALGTCRPRSAAFPGAGPGDTALGISVAHHEMVYCYTSRLSASRRIPRFRLAHYDPNGRREADDLLGQYQNLSAKLARPDMRPLEWRQERVRERVEGQPGWPQRAPQLWHYYLAPRRGMARTLARMRN